MLFRSFISAYAIGALSIVTAIPNVKRAFDYATSGQYNIYNCGSRRAIQMQDLLDDLYDALQPAIRDSKRPGISPAFQTFFKSSTNKPFVTSLLTNITKGTAMTPAFPPYSPNGSPVFFCVDGENQFSYNAPDPSTGIKRHHDAYTTCIESGNQIASYIGFTPPKQFIVICPVFWTSRFTDVPPPKTCLTTSTTTNKFRENGERQRLFRIWLLLEELAHYYIYTSTLKMDAPDIYDANKCFRLAAKSAYLNAVSYVYYVANIFGKCTGFPLPHDGGREILEVSNPDDPSDYGLDDLASTPIIYNAINLTVSNG